MNPIDFSFWATFARCQSRIKLGWFRMFGVKPSDVVHVDGREFPVFNGVPASNPVIQMGAMIKRYDPWHSSPYRAFNRLPCGETVHELFGGA